MKASIFIFLTVGLSFFLCSFSESQSKTYSLTVKVEKLQNSKSFVQIELYNIDDSIPDKDYKNYYRLEKAEIVNGESEITFKNLPSGKYAVNILHDEDSNSMIDKGLPLPKEGIVFSNYQT